LYEPQITSSFTNPAEPQLWQRLHVVGFFFVAQC